MIRERLVPLILAAGVLALAHNAVVFSRVLFPATPVGARHEADASTGKANAEALPDLAIVGDLELGSYLDSLPDLSRSPFLTREENPGRAGASARTPSVPRVSGTLVGPERRVAWISGNPVSEGDMVAGFQVARIDADRVLLRGATRELVVATTEPVAPRRSAAATAEREGPDEE